jgi:hypothetical protein
VMITSIEDSLTRPDLADRTYTLVLPPIPEERRQMKTRMLARCTTAAPGILALLLEGVVAALKQLSTVDQADLPRTADFAAIAIASASAFGWEPAAVKEVIRRNRADAVMAVIEADALAEALFKLASAAKDTALIGGYKEILDLVNATVAIEVRAQREWPKTCAQIARLLELSRRGRQTCLLLSANRHH